MAMPAFIQQFGQAQSDGTRIFTSTQTSILTAIPVVGAVIGLPLTAWMADRFGRKKTIMVGAGVGAVGAAMEVAAFELGLLTAGRAIASKSVFLLTLNKADDAHAANLNSWCSVLLLSHGLDTDIRACTSRTPRALRQPFDCPDQHGICRHFRDQLGDVLQGVQ